MVTDLNKQHVEHQPNDCEENSDDNHHRVLDISHNAEFHEFREAVDEQNNLNLLCNAFKQQCDQCSDMTTVCQKVDHLVILKVSQVDEIFFDADEDADDVVKMSGGLKK